MALLWASQHLPTRFSLSCVQFQLASTPQPKYFLQNSSFFHSKPKPVFKICCSSSNENQRQFLEGFSQLDADPAWESGSVWTTMALYFFSLHIPFSFGGLSVVAQILHQPTLDPQVKAVAVVVIEILELFGALLLIQFSAKRDRRPVNFFKAKELRDNRNWVLAALLGLVFVVLAVFSTSLLADRLIGTEEVNNQALKEILSSGIVSQAACTIVYCIIAPLLEELVYRGFLLASLAPSLKWHRAVILSSVIFSAAHLSGENFIQLFIIGLGLGTSFCWTGDLRSSILLHSMYNAVTLFIAYLA